MKRAQVCFILLLTGAQGCGGASDEASGSPAVEVELSLVVRDSIPRLLEVTGRLVPTIGGSAVLTAPVDAVVSRVSSQLGDTVRAGRLLVTLDAPEVRAQVATLRAQADAAEADAHRQALLLAEGITARRDAEERSAAAGAARASLAAAESLLARTRVRSPIDGVVQRVHVNQGERVAAGEPLVDVVNVRVLDLAVDVPERDVGEIRVGQAAIVAAEGSGERSPARVLAVAPAIDGASNTGRALLRVLSEGPHLRPGAGAHAWITLDVARNVLVVPESALVYAGERLCVFVVGADSVAHAHLIEVGAREGGRVEVRGALRAGDRVVTVGAYGLSDSMRVVPSGSVQE